MTGDVRFDFARPSRIGLGEAVFCSGKTPAQIDTILEQARGRAAGILLTRLDLPKWEALAPQNRAELDYCALSGTAYFGPVLPIASRGTVAIVAAGTSDAPVAREAWRTLRHSGVEATLVVDVGVAGLWRLMESIETIRAHPIVIAVAGMDAALASVLGGLVASAVIGVPTSVGYGAAENGRTALNAMLVSCAPGLAICNIDNGYGAASAALRMLAAAGRLGEQARG